jgi:transposase
MKAPSALFFLFLLSFSLKTEYYNMSFQIFYEDGHGNAVDEYGRPEPMDYIIDEERYALETVSSHTQYLHNQPQENSFDVGSMADEDAKGDIDVCIKEVSTKRAYTLYTGQYKVRFFKLMFEKVMSASAAAKQLGIHVCTAQRWAQMYKTDPDSVVIKHKKTGRSRILHEVHKQVILKYIDENPSAVLEQVMERLLQKFQDLKVSKSTVYNFVRTKCNLSLKNAQFQPVDRNSEEKIQERFDWVRKWECTDMDFRANCVFLDESAFHINLKRSMVWSKKGLPAVLTVPKTRAQTTTILGATSASGLIKCSLRLPR